MNIFVYNMDRQNDQLIKSLDDFLVKKQELLSFGKVESEVIVKNNGYLILSVNKKSEAAIWMAVKTIATGCNASYWVTDYSDELKFVTLKKKIHEFKKVHESKKVEVTQNLANDLQDSMTSLPKPKKEFKKLDKIKLDELSPSSDFTLDVKFNPDKPLSLAQVGREKKLIKIPTDSQIVIRGNEFNTNNEEVKAILTSRGFSYNEGIPTSV